MTQETYARTVLETYGMAGLRSLKTPAEGAENTTSVTSPIRGLKTAFLTGFSMTSGLERCIFPLRIHMHATRVRLKLSLVRIRTIECSRPASSQGACDCVPVLVQERVTSITSCVVTGISTMIATTKRHFKTAKIPGQRFPYKNINPPPSTHVMVGSRGKISVLADFRKKNSVKYRCGWFPPEKSGAGPLQKKGTHAFTTPCCYTVQAQNNIPIKIRKYLYLQYYGVVYGVTKG